MNELQSTIIEEDFVETLLNKSFTHEIASTFSLLPRSQSDKDIIKCVKRINNLQHVDYLLQSILYVSFHLLHRQGKGWKTLENVLSQDEDKTWKENKCLSLVWKVLFPPEQEIVQKSLL